MGGGSAKEFIHEGILTPAERYGVHTGIQQKLVRILLTRMRGREDQGDGLPFRSLDEIRFALGRVSGGANGGIHGTSLKTTPRPFRKPGASPLDPPYH
jgi:hypothetical protein